MAALAEEFVGLTPHEEAQFDALVRVYGQGQLALEWDTTGGILHYSEFSGCGGTSDGASLVPGVCTVAAANHDFWAIGSHELNFPHAQHFQADITKLPMDQMPWCHLFTASPACPAWTTANGVKMEFDQANAEDAAIEAEENPQLRKRKEEYKRSRLLMKEVPRYLRAQVAKGRPVPIGWIENVIQCRKWHEWDAWVREIRLLGYKLRLIAFNSMHARPVRGRRAPQSRDRLYLAFWHESLGRDPDWDKWLRPKAWCDNCVQVVDAVQVFKDPSKDMGRYGSQYFYQCPNSRCRAKVNPEVVPALAAIDATIPGTPIGARSEAKLPPLKPATIGRIVAGIIKYWLPMLTPVGGTWRGDGDQGAVPLDRPMPARTTRECDAVAVPPLMVPVEGRPGKTAASAQLPLRTCTTRNETGVVLPMPFITPLRGGGDKERARPVTDPLSTVTASGNHHGLAVPPNLSGSALSAWATQLLVPFYTKSESASPATNPMGALTTHDRYGVAATGDFDQWAREMPTTATGMAQLLDDVLFRMLEPHEVGAAMAFRSDYQLTPRSKRGRVKLFGNAVTPPVAEVITSALVECLTGESLERELVRV